MKVTTEQYEQQQHFHKMFLATALTVALLSLLGIVFFISQVAGSSNTNFSFTIIDPNAQPVTSNPPANVAQGANGPIAYFLKDDSNIIPDTGSVTDPVPISLLLEQEDGSIPNGGRSSNTNPQSAIPIISDNRVTFKGNSDFPRSLIFLEVHAKDGGTVTSSFNSEDDGSWSWSYPDQLTSTRYTIYVFVFDPSGNIALGSTQLSFEVAGFANIIERESRNQPLQTVPRTSVELPPSLVEQRQVLFDIRAEIIGADDDQTIQPGDEILAQISLLNIGSPGFLIDALVNYTLFNSDGNIIFQEEETIAVSTQASYLKRFKTSTTLPEGDYQLQASVSYEDTKAVSSDQFTIAGDPVILLPGQARVNVTLAIQVLVIIFALAIIVTYLEFRNVELLRKIIHQVTEEDLLKKGYITE